LQIDRLKILDKGVEISLAACVMMGVGTPSLPTDHMFAKEFMIFSISIESDGMRNIEAGVFVHPNIGELTLFSTWQN
jgi:hypothetical protein